MNSARISLITVCYNAAATIERCICSVIDQKYSNLEYIVIDGGSTDGTLSILDRYKDHISIVVSEPDGGIYHAMNKGITMATGEITGVLNADDYFAYEGVLNDISHAFIVTDAGVLYGDIDYVNSEGKIIRKWRSGYYKQGDFNYGWMPPHPSFYVRSTLFKEFGGYKTAFGSATDYELMLRFMHTNRAKAYYLKKVMIKMQTGGVSNKSLNNRLKAWKNDFKAMKSNGLLFPHFSVLLKPFRKITQYIH